VIRSMGMYERSITVQTVHSSKQTLGVMISFTVSAFWSYGAYPYATTVISVESGNGEYISASSRLRDVHWHERTCLYGWHVQGIWPTMIDVQIGKFAEPTAVNVSSDEKLLVHGDDAGNVKISCFPAASRLVGGMFIRSSVTQLNMMRLSRPKALKEKVTFLRFRMFGSMQTQRKPCDLIPLTA
jgi:hypothetical protein